MTPLKCYEGYSPRIEATKEFMEKNRLSLGRPQEEIRAELDRYENRMFDFRSDVFVDFLALENARDLLTDEGKKKYDIDPSAWAQITNPLEACQDFLDYMVFAWMKALDERGISALRSIQKLSAWLWIMGRADLSEKIEDDSLYNPYGAPALIAVCEELGITVPDDLREFAKHKCN